MTSDDEIIEKVLKGDTRSSGDFTYQEIEEAIKLTRADESLTKSNLWMEDARKEFDKKKAKLKDAIEKLKQIKLRDLKRYRNESEQAIEEKDGNKANYSDYKAGQALHAMDTIDEVLVLLDGGEK